MPICIECCYPVKTLYTEYAAAGDGGSASGGVRLTQCPRCKKFADRYIEFDHVIVFIDLVLIKPQVYRHLLFNSLARDDDRFDPSVIRLGVLLLLFDVYLTWARLEKLGTWSRLSDGSEQQRHMSTLADQSIGLQYIFFLVLSALSTLSFHLSIRFLTTSPYSPFHLFNILPSNPPSAYLSTTTTPPTPNNGSSSSTSTSTNSTIPPPSVTLPTYIPPNPSTAHTRPNAISTALFVSSSTKLFPVLMVIWDYDVPAAARSLGWAVVANNVEALKILLDCPYWTAGLLTGCGAAVRWAVGRGVLWAVGLEDEGMGVVWGGGWSVEGIMQVGRDWGGILAFG